MIYCFDLDNTICATPSSKKYEESVPYRPVINKINRLKTRGFYIKIFTARGSGSGIDWSELTEKQLKTWGVDYDELILGKPSFDIFIDDKARSAYNWRRKNDLSITGLVASTFDLLHAGHCLFLKEAKSVCDFLYVALQTDPNVDDHKDRPLQEPKNSPIQSLEERRIQLEAVSYVDEIIEYTTEEHLRSICKRIKPNIRILGSDYQGKHATGQEYSDGVIYHQRDHGWSTSELRSRVNKGLNGS